MIIKLTADQFENIEGVYYSPAFMQDDKDSLISVAVWLEESGEASMQASLDQEDWVDVTGTSFACNTSGLQTYAECHLGLAYRIKTNTIPTKAWILA